MEMPNTSPQTTTQERIDDKHRIARESSLANFSFYIGATNHNIDEILKSDPKHICGVKIFMGSSTGNMLVDDPQALEQIFEKSPILIATHCEDEGIITQNKNKFIAQYGDDIPTHCHPEIRSEAACYASSSKAVALAKKHGSRLHVLHISTAKELELFTNQIPLNEKNITAEVCVHHLRFNRDHYDRYGNLIKWNPAIKHESDQRSLFDALSSNVLDVIATDHAPHELHEKKQDYLKAPAGGPLVQHGLVSMLEFYHEGKAELTHLINKMTHAVADCFQVNKRGYIREGYYADLVLVDLNQPWTVTPQNLYYKCGWSPFNGTTFQSKVTLTLVNGHIVFNEGVFNKEHKGMALAFNR